MLKRTFIHLPKVGPVTEARFWRQGLHTWEDFLKASRVPGLHQERLIRLRLGLEESLEHVDDPGYFTTRLPSGEAWRLFQQFRTRAAYLDIETTGDSWYDMEVTVIGLYDGRVFYQFVQGENLHEFRSIISNYQMLITFNGAQFDLPVLRNYFGDLNLDQAHIDLRFVLARLGYKGGLKRIEPQLGVIRPPDLEGLDGYDAVLLWQRYQRGDYTARDLLLRYNREDVINLEYLMEQAYQLFHDRLFSKAL
jgi:hypothetical protein